MGAVRADAQSPRAASPYIQVGAPSTQRGRRHARSRHRHRRWSRPLSAGCRRRPDPQEIRFHGHGYDNASVITSDGSGNSYVGGYSEPREGANTFVVIKLGPDGAVRWTARYDGSRGGGGGQADAVAVDAAGNVYAAGYIAEGEIFSATYDYLVVKFGPDGTQRWAQRYNGPGNYDDFVRQIAVDGAGNTYVTGFSYGEGYGYDWATLKFSPTGALLWERRLSGPAGQSDGRASELALLSGGNLVVAGVTQTGGEQFPDNDVELVAYDPQGSVVWQRRWSDTAISHEFVWDLDVDGSGRITITGTTQENRSPYLPPLPLTLRYDSGGTLLQTIRTDGGSSVDVDGAGTFYVTGSFVSAPSTVAKFSAGGARVWSTPLTFGDFDFLSMPVVAADAAGAVTVAGTLRDTSIHIDHYMTIRFAADGASCGATGLPASPMPGSGIRSPISRSTPPAPRWSPARRGTATGRSAARRRTS